MSHKPIIEVISIGITNWSFAIQRNTSGVAYRGQQFFRVLGPEDRLGATARSARRGLTVHVVDVKPQEKTWTVQLPTQNDQDFFTIQVSLSWRVADPRRMVEDEVEDTEKLITRRLEPILRRKAAQYGLSQYREAEQNLREAIEGADLPGLCGLELVDPPETSVTLSEADRRRIKEITAQERTLRGVNTADHTVEAPSKDPAYKYGVQVTVTYQVQDSLALPADSPAEAEKLLWPKMLRILKRSGRQFEVVDVGLAETKMQESLEDELDNGKLDGFGLKIISVDVAADLDEVSRARYVELAKAGHEVALQKAKRDGLAIGAGFYLNLMKQGSLAAVAMAVSNGEISFAELAERMSAEERVACQVIPQMTAIFAK